MPLDRLGQARANSNFYRSNYRFLLKLSFLLALVILAQVGSALYLILNEPPVYYFATTMDGKIVEIKPLSNGNR